MIKASLHRYLPFLLCIFCLVFSSMAFSDTLPKVTQIRISASADATRLVFDVTDHVKDRYISYDAGSKHLRLDIKSVSLATTLSKAALKNTLIKDYILVMPGKDDVCFNFDLTDAVEPKLFGLGPSGDYGYRLVLDLKKKNVSGATEVGRTKEIKNNEEVPIIQAPLKPQLTSPKKPSSKPRVIVIDPGHGGKDPGAVGVGGHHEKVIVLQIAKILRDKFNKTKGYTAVLTRDSDVYIPLRQRLAIARRHKADFFISIHADAYKDTHAKGASIFALSEHGATSEMARWMAKKENESELLDGVHASNDKVLRSVLLDLSQTHAISCSLQVGRNILKHLGNMTYLHSHKVEQAAFVVLKSPDIPSVLVETGFISNPGQERELVSKSYQTKIADAIVKGVRDYFAKHPRE